MQEMQETQSLGQEDPLEEGMQPTPVFSTGKFCGQRSLVGYSPWGHKKVRHDWAQPHKHKGKPALIILGVWGSPEKLPAPLTLVLGGVMGAWRHRWA